MAIFSTPSLVLAAGFQLAAPLDFHLQCFTVIASKLLTRCHICVTFSRARNAVVEQFGP